jgi:hypothetical protein
MDNFANTSKSNSNAKYQMLAREYAVMQEVLQQKTL